jgi:hypothetical protein
LYGLGKNHKAAVALAQEKDKDSSDEEPAPIKKGGKQAPKKGAAGA